MLIDPNKEDWGGEQYPKGRFPTSGKSDVSGVILKLTFLNFVAGASFSLREHSNYRQLVRFLLKFNEFGERHSVVDQWASLSLTADEICTISTNLEWNTLFSDKKSLLSVISAKLHAANRAQIGLEYLPLSGDPAVAN